jgi:hypothetical protein
MKKAIYICAALVAAIACKGNLEPTYIEDDIYVSPPETRKFTFKIMGDFNVQPKTKALIGDGKEMTDLWIFDYMDGVLIQQRHQMDTDEDWGAPVMNLRYGQHHVYFVASRGDSPELDAENCILTWGRVKDTFWKDYSINVNSTVSSNRSVTLDRVVTKLKVCFADTIAANASTFNVTPGTWYFGLDYTTGEPCEAKSNETIIFDIPANMLGTDNANVTVFGFSSTTEWSTSISLNSKTAQGDIIGAASISSAPFLRNRCTQYTGSLFTAGGTINLSLDDEWSEDSVIGTW